MSNWYDNGIKGKDNDIVCSIPDNTTTFGYYTFNVINGYKTVALTQGDDNSTYSVLLLTTKSGVQIYLEIKRELDTTTVYRPTETCTIYKFPCRCYIRKNGINTYISSSYSSYIARTLDNNIYLLNSRIKTTDPVEYDTSTGSYEYDMPPFPKNGSSAMNNATLCFSADDDGIWIYSLGFSCNYKLSHSFLSNPSIRLFKIPNTILNNQEYFNPADDNISNNEKEKGGTDTRPKNDNYTGVDIDFPDLPTGASALGLSTMQMYNPTSTQLSRALDILYTDTDESTLEQIIETCKKWWYKPQQYCVSCMLTPVPIQTTSNKNIYFGKYDTEVSAPVVESQWQIVDCGTLSIPLMYGNYLDFTKVQALIFLPYIGFRNININEIMGGNISIKYYIDIYTGSGLCFIKCSNIGSNNSVLYSYECNVNTQVPITSNDYSNIVSNLLKTSSAVVTTIATGGASAPITTGMLVGESVATSGQSIASTPIQTSGCLNANTGVLGNPKPYVVLHFPVSIMDDRYIEINGNTSNYTVNIGSLSGFNSFKNIHLDGINLPDVILREVESQFKSGIII